MSVTFDEVRTYIRDQIADDKNRKFVNVSGDSLHDALREASIELSVPIKRIQYEVLEKGSAGVLGLGKKPWLLLAYPLKGDDIEVIDESSEFDFALAGEAEQTDRDGEAFVRIDPDGVYLKVTPPNGSGQRVTEREALGAITRRSIDDIDTSMVAKVVKHAAGEFVRVANYEHNPANDAALTVSITDLEMKAYLTAYPPGPGGADPRYDDIVSFLQMNNVVDGLKEDLIRQFCDRPVYKEAILVAEGSAPVNGADARIVYAFETDRTTLKLKETDGRVDFKELNLVQNVVEGQELARKIPAEKGTAGRTVTGRLLPAKDGADVRIDFGKNVRLSEDKATAFAETNGQVLLLGGRISVEPVYVVAGDVNLKTGNILFLGTVVVKGNVDDGFNVKAAGNIEVMGSVGKSQLDAEGDIIVHQGVTGRNAGVVRAGNNVYSKFIENARTEAGGLVVVSDGIINSEVHADKKIVCRGKRASIVGGKVRATEEIDAKNLGSVAGMETVLEVGYDPKSKEKLVQLEKRSEELQNELADIKLNLSTLENLRRVKRTLPEEKVASYKELKTRAAAVITELKEVALDGEEVRERLSELKLVGKVSASGTVYPGVKIHVKDASLDIRNEHKTVTFIAEDGIIKVTKYQESDEDIRILRKE
ncbi:MAG: DUF342 domain-containing protein [Spirochaetaceae bacterium]|nr:MAG: DUF342 domain-containing protein [Spirochaetaceae bacterium]